MPDTSEPLTRIKLRGNRTRQAAEKLVNFHRKKAPSQSLPRAHPIRVVCVSDTHNKRPEIPFGDLLIHAGDLTDIGSFDEVQAELSWLSSQPHKYKVLVAGNHDVLFDKAFLEKHPRRRYGQTRTRDDLDFGSVIYLEDSAITVTFPTDRTHQQSDRSHGIICQNELESRSLTIFGSPWTPQYGVSAFQYRPDEPHDWGSAMARIPDLKPDIIVTHGPPQFHLDTQSFHRAGCPYLAEEVARIRPRMMVFGHIHVGYGREDIVLDRVQRAYEELMAGWAGWATVFRMAVLVACSRLGWLLRGRQPGADKLTTFVNAAVVSGPANELQNVPIVVEL